jgi:hypothetical protein
MIWFRRWLFKKAKDYVHNSAKVLASNEIGLIDSDRKTMVGLVQAKEAFAEGEERINFTLTSAIGGRILNVNRYNPKTDRHDQQTYVIPSGEDVGARVAKILNLELFK